MNIAIEIRNFFFYLSIVLYDLVYMILFINVIFSYVFIFNFITYIFIKNINIKNKMLYNYIV